MTFEQLHFFLEIAKDMNFTKAANRLFISQSTLSRQIAALESDLGARLLIRDTRSVELTEAGQLLVETGSELFAKKQEIEERIWRLSEGLSGKINLVSISMQTSVVYEICHSFQMRHPNITLNLATQNHGTTVQLLEEGLADVGVGLSYEMEHATSGIEALPIQHDQFYVIVSENHSLADRASVAAAELRGETFVVARDPVPSSLAVRVHEQLGMDTERRKDTRQPHTLEEMVMQVKAGMGIGVLPGVMCRRGEGYQMLRIEGVPADYDVVMVWKKESNNPSMACFKEVARELLQSGK